MSRVEQYVYYDGYLLNDICTYELTTRQVSILNNAIFLVDNAISLRQLSRETCRSKSQLSRDFKELRTISYELYKLVVKQYKINKSKYFV